MFFKSFMFSVLVFAGFITSYAQETQKNELHADVEYETAVSKDGRAESQVKTNLTYGGKRKAGLYCWIQFAKGWQQVYCGPTYKVRPWMQAGFAVGMKTGSDRFQYGGFIWAGRSLKGKFVSNLFLYEKGNWYRNVSSVKLNDRVTLSLATQRYSGTGPRIDYRLSDNVSVGVESNFSKSSNVKFSFKLKL